MKPRNASDETEILGKLVSDRDLGFTMLVRKYQPAVYSGALRLTHRHSDAEEVAQDTFLRAYRALVGYDRERISKMKLQPWLWTIALNLCRDRASSRTTVPAPEIDLATTDEQPLDTEAWNRRLSALSDDQRLAVVLRHVADLSIADITAVTGRPQGTVKADISRGISRLREQLAREDLR